MDVKEFYQRAVEEKGFTDDPAQRRAVERLQVLYEDFVRYKYKRSNRLKKLFNHPKVPQGVYLWGGIGRGKSFLMDSFYTNVPLIRKTRLHFHEFMRTVHRELEDLKGTEDPLYQVARRIAKRYRLICFDEFHVSDIADAMILYRLLQSLFTFGTSFVMTSNYPPEKLYPDGLQRERFLPAIELLTRHLDILNVDAGKDYRQSTLQQLNAYHTPLDHHAELALNTAFNNLSGGLEQSPSVSIEHREIIALRRAASVIWFDFSILCGGPRSQNDYLEIAQRFHTIILSGVPCMGPRQASEARRFTWLIDILYDHRIKLIMSAACAPQELYTEGALANEFQRTVSRIIEMQSSDYLVSEVRPVEN